MTEKKYHKIKVLFLMQSFMPLFILLCIQHFDIEYLSLTSETLYRLFNKDLSVIVSVICHPKVWKMIVFLVSAIWVVTTLLYMLVFKEIQTAGFSSTGEKIETLDYHDDVGLNFFASYLLPLIIDINTLQDFLVFSGMLLLIFIMVCRSNLYYENPALTIWGYRTFSFKMNSGVEGVGITYGKKIEMGKRIRRKSIIDNLYFIYNENKD